MKTRSTRFWTIIVLAIALVALTAAPLSAQEALPRNETLYVGGIQWAIPATFFPYASNAAWPSGNNPPMEYLYESLFAYNVLTGAMDPLLAKDLTFTDPNTAVVTLQDGTHWQDGTPLTPDDVIYTFELGKTHADVRYATFWNYVNSMTATGDRTIEIDLNPDSYNPGIVKDYLSNVQILPKHIWESQITADTSVSQIVDLEPVGSGPYKVMDYSDQRVATVRDDNYWGTSVFGTPAPKYIVHPIYASNDETNLALQNGEIDMSQTFVPQIWQMWEQQGAPVGTWFSEEPYYVPANIPLVTINVHKPGLDNPLVRRALAYSINYPQIAATAMSRYSAAANSSLILPVGGEEKYYDADQVSQLGWTYDPAQAQDILENQLNATKGSDGVYVLPDGTRLGPWTVQATYGWTDWDTAVEIMAQNAQDAGFDVTTQFPDFPTINAARQNGDFDMMMWTQTGASMASPWARFRDVLDDRGVADFGQPAFWNQGRFSNPDVAGLLDQAAAATDDATLKDLYGQLDKIFIDNIPAIPLMYRPLDFYEFNESVWTGFPTESDPTAPPMTRGAGVEVLYVIHPK